MRKFVLFLISSFLFMTAMQAAVTPTAVIQKALQKVNTGAFVTQYKLSTIAKRGGSATTYSGKITMKGTKYKLVSEGMDVWYDGKTQWVYMVADGEVTVSHPTQKELAQLNPLLFIQSLQKTCTAAFSPNIKSQTEYVVEYYPKDKFSRLTYLRVYVRKSDYVPTRIKLVETKGGSTDVTLSHQLCNQQATDATFIYPKAKYPKVQVNDLR